MADTKISAATAVVTPASTDEYPTNQGGASKKTTRAQMHSLETGEHLVLPEDNDVVTPTIGFGGTTGFYSQSAGVINISLAGVGRFLFSGNDFRGLLADAGRVTNASPSATIPTLKPRGNDVDSGIGSSAADNVSIICGALEAIRAEDPADLAASETSLWLYDLDNGAIQQVTVGAADSGGSGFKVLRIPN